VTHNHWDPHQAGAAGLLLVHDGSVLLQLRSGSVQQPGTWSIPGGARGKDETPQDAALREASEEAGIDPQAVKIVATYSDPCECTWSYTTLIANLIGTVELHGNWEGERLELVPLEDVAKRDLHPGFKATWPALRDMLKAGDTQANISQVTEQLWTGGDRGRTTPATWLAQLQHAGITAVIDCRPHGRADQEWARAHTPDIEYLLIGQPDNGQQMPDEWFADGVDFALRALKDPAARVLIHCELGINRGPSMAFAVLLAQGFTPEQARSQIVAARPIARIRYADQATKWWANLTAPEPEVFYHGGAPGLHVGDMLLPPTITGATTLIDIMPVPTMPASWQPSFHKALAGIQQRENLRVFVTKDLIYAAEIAALHAGNVYRVEPLDNLADRTILMHSETTCDRARILEVVMENVTSWQHRRLVEERFAPIWQEAQEVAKEVIARRKAATS
jgi:8-oxo-dGTP pyrophosphatase MutT (NUDIX family)